MLIIEAVVLPFFFGQERMVDPFSFAFFYISHQPDQNILRPLPIQK